MQRVLVTGATGFLGGYIIKVLEAKGYHIIAFGRNETIGKKLISDQTTFYQGDLRYFENVNKVIIGCDVVVHSGALSTLWGKWEDFYEINVAGTENVLKACKENGVRKFVFISSPSIYTSPKDKLNIREDEVDPNNDLNYYIKSKIMAERAIQKEEWEGIERVVIRPRGIFGIGDTSIIPRLLRANDKIGIPLINGGKNLMDITYVENVAHAIYLAIKTENIHGEIFNISNDEPIPFKELLNMFLIKIEKEPKYLNLNYTAISKIISFIERTYKFLRIKKEPIFTKYSLMTLAFSHVLNIDRAKEVLGYAPIYTIDEGIEIYAKWYRKTH